MILQVDDLEVGQWVVLLSRTLSMDSLIHPRLVQTGRPFQIVAVDLPFVLLTDDGDERMALDTRLAELQRCSLEYVQAWGFSHAPPPRQPQPKPFGLLSFMSPAPTAAAQVEREERPQDQPDPTSIAGNCRRCGRALHIGRPLIGEWKAICHYCGWKEGDPVPAAA